MLAKQPVIDFAPPDESQWPTPQFIDEYGRHYSTYYANPAARHHPHHRGGRDHHERAPEGHDDYGPADRDTDDRSQDQADQPAVVDDAVDETGAVT